MFRYISLAAEYAQQFKARGLFNLVTFCLIISTLGDNFILFYIDYVLRNNRFTICFSANVRWFTFCLLIQIVIYCFDEPPIILFPAIAANASLLLLADPDYRGRIMVTTSCILTY